MSGRGVALACLVTLPSLAAAAEWKITPQLTVAADADTNRRLQLLARDSESAELTGVLAIARLTEISSLVITPRATVSRYSGEDALDSDDWGINTLYRRTGERFQLVFSGDVADDSTLVTELGETGFVEGNTRRRATQAGVTFSQYLGLRHLLQYQLGGSDIDYQSTVGTGLLDYRYPSASFTYAFTATPRLDATFSVNAARLDAPESHLQSDTRGAQVGFRFRLSERFDLDMSTGQSITSARGHDDSKQSFRGSISWHDELSRLDLSLSRAVEPSGRGILVNADDLRLAFSRELTEFLTVDASARISRREDFAFNLERDDYRYAAATVALTWKLDESWTLACTGAYARQEHTLSAYAPDGRRIGFSLAWRPLQ
ncbi:MAG: hypothetical protein ABI769_16230 [Pseudomonadota bacterium]